ncbi:MAG: hypothetical protein IJC04_11765 [Oscillospiraceae bacterium]|nr:hypothetical protein [Oscillospiraceae bacterium]
MKTFLYYIIIALCAVLLSGCGAGRKLTASVNTEQRDSVRIKVVTEYVKDTVFVEVPAQTAERTTRDSTSHLENDFATSDARINSDGSLFHNLNTKPQKRPAEIQKPVEKRDSVVYRTKTVTEIKEVPVPRELTWFQKTQIYGFWACLAFLLIKYTIKRFGGGILNFLRKLLSL